jgi:hypothetical protein
MKFRCPHCQKLLETDEVGKFLCPICKKWSRVPVPKKKPAVAEDEEILDVIAVPPEPRGPRREAITDRAPDERRPRRRRDEEDEDVEREVVGRHDEEDRPRLRKRRRRRRSSGGGSFLDSINLPLILLIVLAPLGLLVIVGSFFTNPIAGFASILCMGGWIWLLVIAAEDGLGTVALVMFVPCYVFIYASQNWDRVGIPFLMMLIGNIGMGVGGTIAGRNAPGRRMEAPAPVVRMLASAPRLSSNVVG